MGGGELREQVGKVGWMSRRTLGRSLKYIGAEKILRRSLKYIGAVIWNSLPLSVRHSSSLS